MKELYWSMNCRDCFNCKQKTFKRFTDLRQFTYDKEIVLRKQWADRLENNGRIDLFWCALEKNPKIKGISPGLGQKREPGKFCAFIDN